MKFKLLLTSSLLIVSALAAAPASASTRHPVPVPTNVVADPLNGAGEVTFSIPPLTRGIHVLHYVVKTYPSNLTTICHQLSCVIPGLANGSSYYFSVAAATSNGRGKFSAQSNEVTPTNATSGATPQWSGYVDTGQTFSSVSANWVVPTVTCLPGDNSGALEWVGINGYGTPTVEQDGTSTGCVNGVATYGAFYEMWGDTSLNNGYLISVPDPLNPGDAVSAMVSVVGDTWSFSITDTTSNWTFATSLPDPMNVTPNSSAEFVVERPVWCTTSSPSSCAPVPFTNVSSVTFTNAVVGTDSGVPSGIPAYTNVALTLINGATTLAIPSAVNPANQSFSVDELPTT
jgi:hypothetical protein